MNDEREQSPRLADDGKPVQPVHPYGASGLAAYRWLLRRLFADDTTPPPVEDSSRALAAVVEIDEGKVTHMPKEYRGSKEYGLIFAELIVAARHRGTVTYQELAELVGLPTRGAYMGGEIGEYLGAISTDEVSHGRPMLSAIAVNVEGKPGGGFYGLAKELGKLTSDDRAEQEAFWKSERQAVYRTWQRTFSDK